MLRIRTVALTLVAGLALVACQKKKDAAPVAMSPDMVKAIVQGKAAEVTKLLDAGESVDALQNGQTALCYAALNNKLDIISLLVSRGANVNHAAEVDGTTPLMYAAKNGGIDAVKTLLAQGAKIDAVDKIGANVLHYAVMGGKKEVAEELIKRDPSLLKKTTNVGLTPIILAINMQVQPNASKSDSDMVAFLKGIYGIGADTLKATVQ